MDNYVNEDEALIAYMAVIEGVALDLVNINSDFRSDAIKSLIVNQNITTEIKRTYILKNAQTFFKIVNKLRSTHLDKIKAALIGTESFTYLPERLKKSDSMLAIVSECRSSFKGITDQAQKLHYEFYVAKIVAPVEIKIRCIATMSFNEYMDPNFNFNNLETWGIPFALDYMKGFKS